MLHNKLTIEVGCIRESLACSVSYLLVDMHFIIFCRLYWSESVATGCSR